MGRMIRTGSAPSLFCHLRLGSWRLQVACERPCDGAVLSFLHKGRVHSGRLDEADARLEIARGEAWSCTAACDTYSLVMPWPKSMHRYMAFLDSAMRHVLLDQRLLVLHAAAVARGTTLDVLVGEAGSGKSTLSVLLARRGGTLLADDRLVLRDGTMVSGCDTTVKLGDDVRDALSLGALTGRRWTNRGTARTEVAAETLVDAAPMRDFATAGGRLVFLRIGHTVSLRHLPRAQALLRLIELTRDVAAGASREQRAAVLSWLGELVEGMSCHELTRSTRLDDLARAAACLETP